MVGRADIVQGSLLNLFARTKQDAFDAFHAKHPDVYRDLVRICREWRRRAGRRRWSIDAAFHQLRWEWVKPELTADEEEVFKLNNNHTAFYSRMIMANEADLAGIFETRIRKAP